MSCITNMLKLNDLIKLAEKSKNPWVVEMQQTHTGLQLILELAEVVIKKITLDMNNYHKCNFPRSYWQKLLGAWLMQFLALAYDRYRLLESVESLPNINNTSQSPVRRIVPRTSYEALKLPETDIFNNQFLRDICKIKFNSACSNSEIYSNPDDLHKKLNFATQPNFQNNNSIKKRILNKFSKLLLNKNSICISVGAIPLRLQLKFFLSGARNIIPIYAYTDGVENYQQNLDNEFRNSNLGLEAKDSEFLKFINSYIKRYIPVCYVEGYGKLIHLSKRYGSAPKAIILNTEMYSRSESFMHWVAKNAASGTTSQAMQHGGNYGMEYRSEKTFIEIKPYDKFYTWGWSWPQFQNDPANKLKPMPSIFLNAEYKKQIDLTEQQGILFTLTSIKENVRRFDCSFMNPYNREKYFLDQIEFFNSLSVTRQKQVKVRLYKDDLNNNYKNRWIQKFPEVKFDEILNFKSSLLSTKLYVGNCLQTTWIEALNINKPIILFVRDDLIDYTPEFKSIIDKLKSVGIFYDNPKTAAHFIEENYDSLDHWWFSKIVQDIISDIQKELVGSSRNFTKDWVKELRSLGH